MFSSSPPPSLSQDSDFVALVDSLRSDLLQAFSRQLSITNPELEASNPPSALSFISSSLRSGDFHGRPIAALLKDSIARHKRKIENPGKFVKPPGESSLLGDSSDDCRMLDFGSFVPSAAGVRLTFASLPRPENPKAQDDNQQLALMRNSWDSRLKFELRSVSTRVNRPLVQSRVDSPLASLEAAKKIFAIRFVYTCEDLLENFLTSAASTAVPPLPFPMGASQQSKISVNDFSSDFSSSSPSSLSAVKILQDFQLLRFHFETPSFLDCQKRFSSLDQRKIFPFPFHGNFHEFSSTAAYEILQENWKKEKIIKGEEIIGNYKRIITGENQKKKNNPNEINEIRGQLAIFAQTGCPPSLRPQIWQILLQSEPSNEFQRHYDSLLASVRNLDFLTDSLTLFDVQETADTDEFFIFEDSLQEIMMAFSRDSAVPELSAVSVNTQPLRGDQDKKTLNSPKSPAKAVERALESLAIPPNTVIPFHRQSMFAAPLCFLYPQPSSAYHVFRSFYCKFFCRLHTLSSAEGSIVRLAALVQRLLLEATTEFAPPVAHRGDSTKRPNPRLEAKLNNPSIGVHLLFHMNSLNFNVLSLIFPWLFSGFSGYLSISEVLILWDRVLAYDSLDLLAILCVSILLHSRELILKCQAANEIMEIFRDLRKISVNAYIQQYLFP